MKSLLLIATVLFSLNSHAVAPVQPTCGQISPSADVSSQITNNVPLFQCYRNTVGECLYNFAKPGTAGGWNTGCPASIAGSNCCQGTHTPACGTNPNAQYDVSSHSTNNVPLFQCYRNTVGECLYNFAKPGTAGGWNTGCPKTIAGNNCCVDEDPCKAKGGFSIKPEDMNFPNGARICCNTKTPKQDILSGTKVCCEVLRK